MPAKTKTTKTPRRKTETQSQIQTQAVESKSAIWVEKTNTKTKKIVLLVAVLILIGLLLYAGRSLFVAAVINGKPIWRITVVKNLEQQYGKQVLETEVTKTIILQEAGKNGISVSETEVNDEYNKIDKQVSSQGQKLSDLLTMQGRSVAEFKEQLKIQKLVEKLLAKDILVTNAEIDDFIAKNKDSMASVSPEQAKEQAKSQLTQQKLSQKFPTWLENAQKNANVTYFVGY